MEHKKIKFMHSKNVTFKDFIQSLLTTVYFQSKIKYLINAKKAYQNLLTVIFYIIKRKYPIRVILKDGRPLTLSNLSDVIFMSNNHACDVCEIKDDLLIIKTGFASVKFSHWRYNGDIIEVWVDEQYKTLPVKNKVVVDIGANIGDSSIYFSAKGASKVLAFEPAPKNYEMLKENITINKITNIEPILAGISSKNCTLTINSEIASNGPFIEASSGQSVSLITLTELVSRYMISDAIMKMDCEGHEYDIILSTNNDVLRKFSNICVEYHMGYLDLKKKLESAGFEIEITKPKRPLRGLYIGYINAIRKNNFND